MNIIDPQRASGLISNDDIPPPPGFEEVVTETTQAPEEPVIAEEQISSKSAQALITLETYASLLDIEEEDIDTGVIYFIHDATDDPAFPYEAGKGQYIRRTDSVTGKSYWKAVSYTADIVIPPSLDTESNDIHIENDSLEITEESMDETAVDSAPVEVVEESAADKYTEVQDANHAPNAPSVIITEETDIIEAPAEDVIDNQESADVSLPISNDTEEEVQQAYSDEESDDESHDVDEDLDNSITTVVEEEVSIEAPSDTDEISIEENQTEVESVTEPTEELTDDNSVNVYMELSPTTNMTAFGERLGNVASSSINNKTLHSVINHFCKTNEILANLVIKGSYDQNSHIPVLWDEGGSFGSHAHALSVASPTGDPCRPTFVYHTGAIKNARHGAFPVQVGSLIGLAGSVDNAMDENGNLSDKQVIVVYKVAEITDKTDKHGNSTPEFKSDLIYAFTDTGHSHQSIETEVLLDNGERIDPNGDFITAITDRLYTENAVIPSYGILFQEAAFDLRDFESCVIDPVFAPTMIGVNSLGEAYSDSATSLINFQFPPKVEGVRYGTSLTVALNYFADKDVIVVFFITSVINLSNRSSVGNRLLYQRFILPKGQSFWYPDNPTTKFSYETVESLLKNNKTNTSMTSFKLI